MGLISPNNKRYFVYFDKVPRSQVIEKLWSLIFAAGWADQEENPLERKKMIVDRLKTTFDVAQKKGSGSYGDDSSTVNDQFSRQYTMGWDLGIWKNSNLDLSDNAKEVFNGNISIRDYITRFCVNLFEYIEDVGYTHPLYLTCVYAIENNKKVLTKDDFLTFLPNTSTEPRGAKEFNEHTQMFMNYLSATYFFDKEKTGNSFNLIFKDKYSPEAVKDYCNLEYQSQDQSDTQEKFKHDQEYADYISKKIHHKFYYELIQSTQKDNIINTRKLSTSLIDQPHQQIFSGAPGTGKSFKLKELANLYFNLDGISNYERITFHPNMNYGQFVGVYKPYPTENENAPVSYDYIPGILLRQLVKALKNPGENYLVLVEEINRANVAAVFGDSFQLLDRDSKGKSEYPIALSKDLERYLKKESGLSEELVNDLKENGLYFPPNLYIWASMNGADQGVMPIDTAFKRRWDFVKFDPNELNLLEFEDNDEGVKKKEIEEEILNNSYINYGDGNKIYWNSLRKTINGLLLKFNIPEDKLMGPYFISRNKMAIEKDVTKEFTSKVLMYLFEDVVKSNPKRLFNDNWEDLYYSVLVENFKNIGPNIFKDINLDSIRIEKNEQQTPLINFIKDNQTEPSELVSEEYTNINAKLTPEESIMTTTLITDDVDRTK